MNKSIHFPAISPFMRLNILCLTLSFSLFAGTGSFACTETLKPFETECRMQDQWNKLTIEYLKENVSINRVKGYAIPRAIGQIPFHQNKNDFLNKPETILTKNKDWQAWNNGQKFFSKYQPVYLELTDVLRLHKSMFENMREAGKLRIHSGETNPIKHYSCTEKMINDQVAALLEDYDVKSTEGYPLLNLENAVLCEDNKSYAGDVIFYKGASMKVELKSWLAEYNDMIERYISHPGSVITPPIAFLSDMKRWFLAIHPFTDGNEALVNILIDYAGKKLELPPIMSNGIHSHLMNAGANRTTILNTTQESIKLLESCLYDIKVKFISPHCSPM